MKGNSWSTCQHSQSKSGELAREIAAFATSGGGRILIGVDDSGNLQGLPNLNEPGGRDLLLRRIEGISHGTVKPPVTPIVRFATESEKAICIIDVPEGTQPLYYVHNIPYLRHLTQSRPAHPEEVIAKVRQWLGGHAPDPGDEILGSALAMISDLRFYFRHIRAAPLIASLGTYQERCDLFQPKSSSTRCSRSGDCKGLARAPPRTCRRVLSTCKAP